MASLKVDQRVKVVSVNPDLGGESYLNQTGVLIEIDPPDRVGLSHRVMFDDEVEFWYRESDLEAVDEWPAKTDTFKVGDTVYLKFYGVTPHKIVEFGEFFDDDTQAAMLENDLGQRLYRCVAELLTHPHMLKDIPASDTPSVKPLLHQQHTENEPKSVRRVLLGEFGELAMKQPHLFFAGSYQSIGLLNMQKLDTPYIRISDSTDSDDKYLVFIIAEGQA